MSEDFIPLKNFVLLEIRQVDKETEAGLVLPSGDAKNMAFVHSKGPDATGEWEIGNCIIFNEYDAQWLGRETGKKYVLVQDSAIRAIVPDPYRLESPILN